MEADRDLEEALDEVLDVVDNVQDVRRSDGGTFLKLGRGMTTAGLPVAYSCASFALETITGDIRLRWHTALGETFPARIDIDEPERLTSMSFSSSINIVRWVISGAP